MIILFENGRLGNQLFQYCGIKKYFPEQKLFFFGFSSLRNSFNIFDVFFINNNRSLLNKILRKFIFFLSDIRIIGKITELNSSDNFIINSDKGLFYNIFLARDVYFQHEKFLEKITFAPKIKQNYIKKAKKWIKKKNIFYENYNLIFVHIRRGDYLSWPDKNYPAVLDTDWYKKNIKLIKKKIKKPIFIIIGDDSCYLKKVFKESSEIFISENSHEIDLSIMHHCSHGILSASSFAWWGAYYAKNNSKDSNIFIAPKYWIGHSRKKWIPLNFYTDWISYKDV